MSVTGSPYSRPSTSKECRWQSFQPMTTWSTSCRSARVKRPGTRMRRQIGGRMLLRTTFRT
jgi:hypothetical protein